MCLAVPLELVEIDGNNGIGARSGIRRSIRLDFIKEPKIGDYVMVHAGFAIERIDRRQAEEDLEAFHELEAVLDEMQKQ